VFITKARSSHIKREDSFLVTRSYGKLLIYVIPNKQMNTSKPETELAAYVNTVSQGHKFLRSPLVTPRSLGQLLVSCLLLCVQNFSVPSLFYSLVIKRRVLGPACCLIKREYAHDARCGHLLGLCCPFSHQAGGGMFLCGVGLSLISPSCCLFTCCSFCEDVCMS